MKRLLIAILFPSLLFAQELPFTIDNFVVGFGGASFVPTDITSVVAWHDSNDTTTMYTDAGATNVSSNDDPVQEWHDKTATGLDYLGSGTARPLYKTAGGILFDGSNDLMDAATTMTFDELHLFIAVEGPVASESNFDHLYAATAGTDDPSFTTDGFALAYPNAGSGGYELSFGHDVFGDGSPPRTMEFTSTGAIDGDIHLVELVIDFLGATSEMFIDGVSVGSDTNTNTFTAFDPDEFFIGGNKIGLQQYAGSEIYGDVYSDAILTGTDLTDMRAWFDTAYTIPGL